MCVLCDNFTSNADGICNECKTLAQKRAMDYHRENADYYAQFDNLPMQAPIRPPKVDGWQAPNLRNGGSNG